MEIFPQIERIETDVLIIGGGLAGSMAAIKARDSNAKVVLIEKGHFPGCGCNSTGCDHIWCWNPEVHGQVGWTVEDLVKDHTEVYGGFVDQGLCEIAAREAYYRLLDLEKYGLKVRFNKIYPWNFGYKAGEYTEKKWRMVPQKHKVPTSAHVEGRNIKEILGFQVKKRGILESKKTLLNRTMATSLLTHDGSVVGATALHTLTGRFIVIAAKATVLATGRVERLYRNTSGHLFNTGAPGNETGDGRSMAFRAGAELVNMERADPIMGFKNFHRYGTRGSLRPAVRIVDASGREFGSSKAFYRESESGYAHVMREEISRIGPLYADLSRATKEELEYAEWAMNNEGNCGWLWKHLKEMGFDPQKHKIEQEIYERGVGRGGNGVVIDSRCRTSLKGLFAAGDEIGLLPWSVAGGAIALGWLAGDESAKYSKLAPDPIIDKKQVGKEIERAFAPLSIKDGVHFEELNLALNDIMSTYANDIRTEQGLKSGLERLMELKKKADTYLAADNLHELMRCLEVLALMDVAEMVLRSALERRESRPALLHYRADYPETDKSWFKWLVIRKEGDHIRFSRRRIKHKYSIAV